MHRYAPDPAQYAAVDLDRALRHERVRCPAWAVARLHGVRVCYAPRWRLDGDCEHFTVIGGRPHVLLRRGLSRHDEARLVAHGVAHYLLWWREIVPEGAERFGRPVVEEWCDSYADELIAAFNARLAGRHLREWGQP